MLEMKPSSGWIFMSTQWTQCMLLFLNQPTSARGFEELNPSQMTAALSSFLFHSLHVSFLFPPSPSRALVPFLPVCLIPRAPHHLSSSLSSSTPSLSQPAICCINWITAALFKYTAGDVGRASCGAPLRDSRPRDDKHTTVIGEVTGCSVGSSMIFN